MNENTNTITYKCEWCGESLSPSHKGPCPKCGKVVKGRKIIGVRNEIIKIKESFNRIREFYKENPIIALLIFVIGFGSPFLGCILNDRVEFIVEEALALLTFLLTPYAVNRVRRRNDKEKK